MELSEFLKTKLQGLQQKNPRVSIRSMARKVDMPAGRLSELIQGKRKLSQYYAEKLSQGLRLSISETQLLASMVSTKSRKVHSEHELREAEISLMSSWEHYAILSLIKTSDFQSSSTWISRRLVLPISTVEKCLQNLSKLKLIEMNSNGIQRRYRNLTSTFDIPSSALQYAHKNDLKKAAQQLGRTPTDFRDYSSITMAIDVKQIKKAKKLIANFRDKLSLLLERGDCKEVYNLNIQLYPVTQIRMNERDSRS